MCRLLAVAVVLVFALPAIADDKPFPKPLKPDEKVKADGWFGKKVLPKRDSDTIRMGEWKDGKQETWTPHNLLNCTVREDRDGFLRVYDERREGWVSKDDMVTAEYAPAYFDKALKANEKDAYAWQMRGIGWLQNGEYDNAIKDFTEAIRLRPESSVYYNSRGSAWSGKKEYDKAIADHTEAIKIDPKFANAFNNRGNAWSGKKEYDKAIADHTEAIKIDPEFAVAVFNRGLSWVEMKEFDKAIADFGEALRLNPKDALAYYDRGNSWGAKKEYQKAVVDYTESARLDPNAAGPHDGLGWIFFENKDYSKAAKHFELALNLNAKDDYAITYLARTFAKLKKYDEAVSGFEKAIELNPVNWIHREFAKFRASCPDAKYRDGKKAVELAKKAIEKAGKDADWEYAVALAMAYAEAGDFELAVAEQRKAVEQLKAEKNPDKDDVKKAEERLELYRAKKPYRDE